MTGSKLTELFGQTLTTKDGDVPTEKALAGCSAIGIYFSAHWCPPCRGFTPKLAQWYSESLKAKGMKIVFVSSDKDEESFTDYYKDMPWDALPFVERDLKAQLSKTFKVSGIPSLVILSPDGETITTEGRDAISSDPQGAKYPWIPPTKAEKAKEVLQILGPDLLEKCGGKPIGLYFSAHWCPPCRGFTPKLAEYYNDGLKNKMEIIFVSSDRDEASFKEYYSEMPWLALPYEKRDEKETLSSHMGVSGIPTFAILNPDGTIITTAGREAVASDPSGESFPDGWLPQPFNSVEKSTDGLNEEQCLVAMGENPTLCETVKMLADEHYISAEKDIEGMDLRFFHAPGGGVSDQLRKLTGQTKDTLILLDIPDNGGYYVCDDANIFDGGESMNSVKSFLKKIKSKQIERQQLKG